MFREKNHLYSLFLTPVKDFGSKMPFIEEILIKPNISDYIVIIFRNFRYLCGINSSV